MSRRTQGAPQQGEHASPENVPRENGDATPHRLERRLPQTTSFAASEVARRRRERIEQHRTVRAFLVKLVVIAAMGYALFTYVFGFAAMKGEQMYPRIRDGDLMLYYRLEDSYTISDVVTFVRDGTRYTGRIVAKSGDTVTMDEAGQLIVNGNIQAEEIFYPTTVSDEDSAAYPLQVPENSLFLLCDMRTQATDSRTYGVVGVEELDGKVITILRRRGI